MPLLNTDTARGNTATPQGATRQYWRSLDELADKPAFRDWMEREFPAAASELPAGVSRRRWLQLMGASLALGGLTGCRWEAEEFAPFTVRPQNRVPGEKQAFRTSWNFFGTARPLTVTSVDGRPIKIEGNDRPPGTRGGTSAHDQALILSLYDPDRSQQVLQRSRNGAVPQTWEDIEKLAETLIERHRSDRGRSLAVHCEPSASPTRQRLQRLLRARFPEMLWCESDPGGTQNQWEGSRLAWGRALRSQVDFRTARIIVCLDADPFGMHPDATRLIGDWADRRDPDGEWMNRLYVLESGLSLTGSNADHRVPVRSSEIPLVVEQLEQFIASPPGRPQDDAPRRSHVLAALVSDLISHRGQSIVLIGEQHAPELQARVHRLNQRLGNIPAVLRFTSEPAASTEAAAPAELLDAMEKQSVQTLLVLDSNPAGGTPLAGRFAAALEQVDLSIHAGLYRDETGVLCDWHLPLAHPLESWDDGRCHGGTVTLSQPLIAPLFGGRTAVEILGLLAGVTQRDAMSLVRSTHATGNAPLLRNEREWRQAVHDGFVSDSQLPEVQVSLLKELDAELPPGRLTRRERLPDPEVAEIVVRADARIRDGRFANSSWLHEAPDPITKLTWNNAAVMSPATAADLGVEHGQVLKVQAGDVTVALPVFALPGVAHRSIQLALGYGRSRAGHVGGLTDDGVPPVGEDVSVLLPDSSSHILTTARLTPTSTRRPLATTQDHFAIDTTGLEAIGARVGELIRTGTLEEYRSDPDFVSHRGPHHPPLESLWEEREPDGAAWGMAIDLNRCIGCNACLLACQSENNVPVVGAEQVLAGREMHWLRIDRYFSGDPADPDVAHQPVACHHCENAPCEQVCPVAATVHSDEGLNDMVYNRCIGTRYCANNCPYKVRRFNFFDYNQSLSEPGNVLTQMIINPDVTVRSRGVMEKCTYCVQRIQDVKITAKNEQRSVADGEIRTACQQACPAEAIVFGDLNDSSSRVAQQHADSRAWGMLAELNVKPRTRYLARIRNPHPWIAETDPASRHSTHSDAQGHA